MMRQIGMTVAAASLFAVAACNQSSSPMSPSSTSGPESFFAKKPGSGNGAPSGAHYSLNIIGVPKDKSADMTGNNGHRIFVLLDGNTRIELSPGDFKVLDANGTDGEAAFQLPNPDPDADGTTTYSVFARALGTPGGSSITVTCATDPTDGEYICSEIQMVLVREKGKSSFQNVSKYLLYIYADIDDDGTMERIPLFDSRLEDFLWEYDNSGLKLAQLRFYECSTTVPDASNPNGPQTTTCFD